MTSPGPEYEKYIEQWKPYLENRIFQEYTVFCNLDKFSVRLSGTNIHKKQHGTQICVPCCFLNISYHWIMYNEDKYDSVYHLFQH